MPSDSPKARPASAIPTVRRIPRTRGERVRAGFEDSLSVGLGVFPLGIALGFLVVQVGLPGWVAPALSIVVFAGSVELLLTTMLAAVAPLSTIAVAVFAVNFRHVFYAFSFPIGVVKPGIPRAYSVYAMIDEAYATAALMPPRLPAEPVQHRPLSRQYRRRYVQR